MDVRCEIFQKSGGETTGMPHPSCGVFLTNRPPHPALPSPASAVLAARLALNSMALATWVVSAMEQLPHLLAFPGAMGPGFYIPKSGLL